MAGEIDKAMQVRAVYDDALSRVRGDLNLSDQGKQERIAALWRDAVAKLEALAASVNNGRDARAAQMQATAYGPPSAGDVASYRAALLTAAGAESDDELLRMMDIAERSGDKVFARAVAVTAVDRRQFDLASRYGATDQRWEDAINELLSTRADLQTTLGEAMVFNIVRPGELAGWML